MFVNCFYKIYFGNHENGINLFRIFKMLFLTTKERKRTYSGCKQIIFISVLSRGNAGISYCKSSNFNFAHPADHRLHHPVQHDHNRVHGRKMVEISLQLLYVLLFCVC